MPQQQYWDSFFDPEQILDALLLDQSRHTVVEFGCGYGTFTLPAARRISGKVVALDLDQSMLDATRSNADTAGLTNVECSLRDFVAAGSGLPDGSADYAMLFNILHLENPVRLLQEVRRNLAPGGLLAVMHWNYDEDTPRGPPLDIRPRHGQCRDWAVAADFSPLGETIDLPPYHYGLVMSR